MPSPPITVGELNDVPAPQSPVNAQFHQETAHRIIHRFASVALMNAWAAGNGAMAYVAPTHYARIGGAWQALTYQANLDAANTIANNAALGILAHTNGAEALGIGGAQEICRVTFTANPARWYRTTAFIGSFRQASAAGSGFADIWDSGTTVLKRSRHTQGISEYTSVSLDLVESGLSGSIVRRLVVTPSGGVIDVGSANGAGPHITISDEGAV